jgi:TonB family protein
MGDRMRIGLAAGLTMSSLASVGAQAHTAGMWVDSVNASTFQLGVSGSDAGVVRVMLRAGALITEIQASGEDVKHFGDSAAVILTKTPRPTSSIPYSVAGAKMRLTYGVVDQREVVHFRIGGDRGVDVQPTMYEAMRVVGILRGAAFWSVEEHRVAGHLRDLYPPTPGAGYDTYFENQVERPAVLRPGSPSPKFPPLLHSGAIEGDVLVQFVVDTLGRVDSTTFHVLKSTHDLFTSAVKDVLFRYRFKPAELGGHKVKQLVQMPFDFRMSP